MKNFLKYWKRQYGHLPKPDQTEARRLLKLGKDKRVVAETLAQENMTPEGFI